VGGAGLAFLSARLVRLYDVALVVWVVFWIVVAVLGAVRIASLGDLADPVVRTAEGLQKTTDALSGLGDIPLIGGSIGKVVTQVRDTAVTARTQAADAKTTIHSTSVLVGVAIGVGMVALGLVLYLPVRLAWRREVADVRRALAADPDDLELGRYLARRAIAGMDITAFKAWGGESSGLGGPTGVWPLAELELRRLGLTRTTGAGHTV